MQQAEKREKADCCLTDSRQRLMPSPNSPWICCFSFPPSYLVVEKERKKNWALEKKKEKEKLEKVNVIPNYTVLPPLPLVS